MCGIAAEYTLNLLDELHKSEPFIVYSLLHCRNGVHDDFL